MKTRTYLYLAACYLLTFFNAFAQSEYFTYAQFISIVQEHHPMAYKAKLQEEIGAAQLQRARGNFDPKILSEIQQKYFDGSTYYSRMSSGLYVPTWFGMAIQAGFDLNSGNRLSNEAYTPEFGLWSAGLSLNLGQGLLIDQRRADLKQAQIFLQSTKQEQQIQLNQLYYDASLAYWDWCAQIQKMNIYQTAFTVAQERFTSIKQLALFGDRPLLDTLKASIFVQERALELEQAQLEVQNSKIQLETFLWQDGFIPLEMSPNLTAPDLDASHNASSLDSVLVDWRMSLATHPEIVLSKNGIDLKKIDYRLKKDALKPRLELKYNALSAGGSETFSAYQVQNYTWGAQFSYPIFTRKERGNVKLTSLHLQEKELELINKTKQLEIKVERTLNKNEVIRKQLEIAKQMQVNYQKLYAAEQSLFQMGESNLFMVNTWNQQQIQSEIKVIDFLLKKQQAELECLYLLVKF